MLLILILISVVTSLTPQERAQLLNAFHEESTLSPEERQKRQIQAAFLREQQLRAEEEQRRKDREKILLEGIGGLPQSRIGAEMRQRMSDDDLPQRLVPGETKPPYLQLRLRQHPVVTVSALEAWGSDQQQKEEGDTLWDYAAQSPADQSLGDALSYLYPPSQQRYYHRRELNTLLDMGTRVAGTPREVPLQYLIREGLGQRRYSPGQSTEEEEGKGEAYLDAPHLSALGKSLLLQRGRGPRSALRDMALAAGVETSSPLQPGWWWAAEWDNFTEAIPITFPGLPRPKEADFQNLVFHFAGGSRFRTKASATPVTPTTSAATVIEQESMVRFNQNEERPLGRSPYMETGKPGTRLVLTNSGFDTELRPSLSAVKAHPLPGQPLRHVVLSAHWDTKLETTYKFLAASDSTVPMLLLLRTMKNIAALTDVVEALTALYEKEAAEKGAVDDAVPGVNALFASRSEEEVRAKLADVLSPAHHALLFQYFFAAPLVDSRERSYIDFSLINEVADDVKQAVWNASTTRNVDVRVWLDWVQHLPAISVILFDGEEAFKQWEGNDNTYGSRHLARQWRQQRHVAGEKGGGGGGNASRYDSTDLFLLYDLLGPAGTQFSNSFPTQSGVFFAELARLEGEKRRRGLLHAISITRDLLRTAELLSPSDWYTPAKEESNAPSSHQPANVDAVEAGRIIRGAHALLEVDTGYITLVARDPPPTEEVHALPTVPAAWLRYGSPHEMFTLHGLARDMFGQVMARRDLDTARRYAPPGGHRYEAKTGEGVMRYFSALNGNIFFPLFYAASSHRTVGTITISDDHIHWLDTQRVLHAIPVPFPYSWHTAEDNGESIDDGTVVDLFDLCWQFSLQLGDYWTRV